MFRRYCTMVLSIGFPALLLILALSGIGLAAPSVQEEPPSDERGQIYVVRPGDSLSLIARQFYGNGAAYPRIFEATNTRAAVDAQFVVIQNPGRIRVGQQLWIPDAPVIADATDSMGTVRFVEPETGASLSSTFDVAMAAEGMTVEPAGDINENAGHFHILVDTEFIPPEEVIPFDEGYLHFGGGQLTTTLTLEPGMHTLRLQFANGAHQALDGPEFRDTITVTVGADAADSMGIVHFVEPEPGASLSSTFDVAMAAEGLTVEPAGDINENAGHFHILVDTEFIPPEEVIPFDEGYLHFGGGQLTTTLTLEPGMHTLRLQFANGAHQALDGPEFRDTITVTVASTEPE